MELFYDERKGPVVIVQVDEVPLVVQEAYAQFVYFHRTRKGSGHINVGEIFNKRFGTQFIDADQRNHS